MNILRTLFGAFLRTRRAGRHFRRLLILDSVTADRSARVLPDALTRELMQAARDEIPALLQRLDSNPDGLTAAEAEAIRERVGLNEVEHEKPLPWWLHLWHCYRNPFNLLLTAAGGGLVRHRRRQGDDRDRHDGRAVDR